MYEQLSMTVEHTFALSPHYKTYCSIYTFFNKVSPSAAEKAMKKTGDTMLLLLLLLLPLLLLLLLLLLLISESWMKYWRSRLTSPNLIMTRLGTSSDEEG